MSDQEKTSISSEEKLKDYEFDFLEMMQQETKMSIILILKTYQSLNLRQISTVLGISEPSTHAHIVQLYERSFIELDPDMASKRGKYYRLDPKIHRR